MKRKIIACLLTSAIFASTFTGCALPFGTHSQQSNEDETIMLYSTQETETEYNTLVYQTLTDDQKIIYNTLLDSFLNFKDTARVTGSKNDVEKAYRAISADRPDIFYVSGFVYDGADDKNDDKVTELLIYPNYICDSAEYSSYMEQVDKVVDGWLADLPQDADDYTRSKYCFDKIISNTEYNKKAKNNQNILSVFLNGKSVAGGYSSAYTYIMQKANIPCATVIGKFDDASQAWNVSKLDQDYYFTDVTNGDSSFVDALNSNTAFTNYACLNMVPSVAQRYVADGVYAEIKTASKADNYFVRENLYYSTYNESQIGEHIKTAAENGNKYLTFSFDNAEVLEQAKDYLFTKSRIVQFVDDTTVNYISSDKYNTLTILF